MSSLFYDDETQAQEVVQKIQKMKKLLFILACVIVPQVSFGAVLYEQTISSAVSTTQNTGGVSQSLGTGLSGTVGAVEIKVNAHYVSPATMSVAFRCYNTADFSSPCAGTSSLGGFSGSLFGNSGLSFVEGDNTLVTSTTTTATLNASKYYYIGINMADSYTGSYWKAVGSATDVYAGGSIAGQTGVVDIYFKVAGSVDDFIPVDGIASTIQPYPQTYLNNPITFSGTYNNGIAHGYDQILVSFDNTTNMFQGAITATTTLQSGTGFSYSFAHNFPLQGNYTYNVRLWDPVNATGTAWFAGNNFSLGTTTATTTPIFNAPALECDTFDLTCYVKKAFIWLIYPTESLVESYNGFLTTIQAKPPIGYFTLLASNLNGLNASSTPLVNVTIPAHLKTYFFTPFDTGIASILWFFFAINFYRRLKHITI